MLRQVFITKDGQVVYKRKFGKALDDQGFEQAYKQIVKEAFEISNEKIKFHDFFHYRINYLSIPDKKIIFMFVSDLSDKFENVKKELVRCRKEFMGMFGDMLDEGLDEDYFEIFNPTIDLIHKNLRPKISLVGFSGVGKTTITRLITADDIPMEHVPTITGDIGTIKIGKLHFHLWDFAGQEQFSFLWNNFIKGSDAVLLITDSSLENCEKSKYFTELIRKEAPYSHTAIIGNKQDLPEAMPIVDIERHLGLKAYSMIAVDPNNRDKMITIIADILEMSGEVSPLLAPLLKRDEKMKEAEEALEVGNFQAAVKVFEELADLSLELGDDRVSQDFQEKSEKIRTILEKMPVSTPAANPPQETKTDQLQKEATKEKPIVSNMPGDHNKTLESPQKPAPAPPVKNISLQPPNLNSIPSPPPRIPPKPPVKPHETPKVPTESQSEPTIQSNPSIPTKPAVAPPKPPKALIKPPLPKMQPPSIPPMPSTTKPKLDSTDKISAIESEEAIKLEKPIVQPIIKSTDQPESLDEDVKETPKVESPTKTPAKASETDQLELLLQKLKKKKKSPGDIPPPPLKSPANTVLGRSSSIATPVSHPPVAIQPPVKEPPIKVSPTAPKMVAPPESKVHTSTVSSDSANIIADLKIKMAKVNKTILDLEMDNITGDLSDEDFEKKKTRLESVKERIKQQIKELQSL